MTGDTDGDGCAWYAEPGNAAYCGLFDTYDFDAKNDCCICKTTNYLNLEQTCYGSDCPQEMDFTHGTCSDNAQGAVDIGGDSCDWYWNNQDTCGWWDYGEFAAGSDCCACNGGVTCEDNTYGATDIGGDGCDWYIGLEEYCGWYDTYNFFASEMCCSCQGQTESSYVNLVGDYNCLDTNFGAGDSWGDGCDWYVGSEDYCDHYNTDYFVASDMCCTCNGGSAD